MSGSARTGALFYRGGVSAQLSVQDWCSLLYSSGGKSWHVGTADPTLQGVCRHWVLGRDFLNFSEKILFFLGFCRKTTLLGSVCGENILLGEVLVENMDCGL